MKLKTFLTAIGICCLTPFSFAKAAPKSYVVYDYTSNQILDSKNINRVQPIASLTKLMTAYVFVSLNENPYCKTKILPSDRDTIKNTNTRLPKNVDISCNELLKAMLIGSDNYAASALSHALPNISSKEFIMVMNTTAKKMGMYDTHFVDTSGLSSENVSSVKDLLTLTKYIRNNKEIQKITNTQSATLKAGNRQVAFRNSNVLVREKMFDTQLSKTGYIRESGYNLVFVNKYGCYNNHQIGVISLNNQSSQARANFTKQKLKENGCGT